jgi:hypothetical protein
LKKLYDHPNSGSPIVRVVKKEHESSWTAETMYWLDPGEEPAFKIIILDDNATAKRAAKRSARGMQSKARSGTWMWWTDGS